MSRWHPHWIACLKSLARASCTRSIATKCFSGHRRGLAIRWLMQACACPKESHMSGYWRHLCLSVALFAAVPLHAADTDPPGRVGRLSLANEGVQLRVGDSVASGGEALNWPLTTGALIDTASGARAEARIGSTTLRIDGGTSLEFVELSDERIWLRLNRGSVILGIMNPEHAAETALDTPQGRLRFDAPGSYRADVAGGTTAFSAYSGTARIEDLGLSIRAGDRILLFGGTDRSYLLGQAASDAFRQWGRAREQLDTSGGHRYVSSEMTGYEELERHGYWREIPEYGPAWFPQGMPPDWAPYRWGRWTWVSPWGWTWIDYAPWGFAPFHYGRWALIGINWAWIPGVYVSRPVYAPALIVWLGQPGWNASFSFGPAPAIGWFPLGPREIYYPYYRSSLRHVRSINVTHVTHVSRIVSVTPPQGHDRHIHRGRHEAMTVVPEQTVMSGAPVNQSATIQDRQALATVPIAVHQPQTARPHGRKGTAPQESAGLPSGKAFSAPQKRIDNSRNAGDHPSRSLPSGELVPASPFARSAPTQPAVESVSPIVRPTAPLSRPADSAPINRPRGLEELPLPPSRRAEPRPMPSQAPAAISLPPAEKSAPTVEAGRHHGPRADHGPRDNEPLKPREARSREQPRPKQGPHER